MERRQLITGYLLSAASAFTFSIKGIFAKLLYGLGVDPVTLLAFRFAIAIPLFWLAVFFFPSGKVSAKDILILVLSGLLGLYAAALADFYGLVYIDASLERVILYTYPAIVVVWARIFLKERLGRIKLASMALTYAGLVLVMKLYGGMPESAWLIGGGLVFFSAVIYSLSYILTEVLSRRISGVKIAAYTTTAAGSAFIATWRGRAVPEGIEAWSLLILIATVSTFVPVLTLALGIKRIGATRSAIVSFLGPVSTAILAYLILGETMDPVQIIGMLLIFAGVLFISLEKAPRHMKIETQTRG
ncbi:MAG: DMT family transporter [Deltaproteobacteria bacterium]|nr:DMT family transporter [Deltaproteobacteria bacterium]